VNDLGDVCVEAVAVRTLGDRSDGNRPAGDLRLARPLGLGTLDRVDCAAVHGEPRIATEIRALTRVRHRAEDQFTVLEGRLDPGNSRRPVGSQGSKCLVSASVEERPNALSELRLCLFEILPRRHTPMIAPETGGEVLISAGLALRSGLDPTAARQPLAAGLAGWIGSEEAASTTPANAATARW
jgi:hypothetical protein